MKKIFVFILALSLLFSCSMFQNAGATQAITFTDVDKASSLGEDIAKLSAAGVINGYGDGTFRPQEPVTRAQLCKMVNIVKNYTTLSDESFSDVTYDKWYYSHVLIGKKAGYINGFPDGSFRGDDYVTREQVCAIIYRAFGVYDLGITSTISDGVSDWALPYVNALIANKLIPLENGNIFRATENMKRGELSTVLAKFVDQSVASDSSPEEKPEEKPVVIPSGFGGGSVGGGSAKPSGPTKAEIIAANAEVLRYLRAVKQDITKANFQGVTKQISDIVLECVKDAISVGESGKKIISKSFVYDEYKSRINKAKQIYYGLSAESRAQVLDTVSQKVGTETQEYLISVFL